MARILVVDDEPELRFVLRETLKDAGHVVFEAADGEEAFEEALEVAPDAVLMDVTMPGRDGFAALAEFRRQPATHSIPVLMLTAKAEPEHRERARVLGAFDYITKPWDSGEIEIRTDWAIQAGGDPARRVCVHPELGPVAA